MFKFVNSLVRSKLYMCKFVNSLVRSKLFMFKFVKSSIYLNADSKIIAIFAPSLVVNGLETLQI